MIVGVAAAPTYGDGIDVKVVKYDGLKDIVVKNKGKVVVVDIWFTT
jgi:hypothetical protein